MITAIYANSKRTLGYNFYFAEKSIARL